MVTRLEPVEPLELPSIRDEVRERRPWSTLATVTVIGVFVAAVATVVALTITGVVPDGRVLGAVLVGAWSAAALFVAVHRPSEPLGAIMAKVAAAGAIALLGASVAASADSSSTRDIGDGLDVRGAFRGTGRPDGVVRDDGEPRGHEVGGERAPHVAETDEPDHEIAHDDSA